MSYCGPRGIPLSEFDAWSDIDQAAALAWQRRENEKCPSCRIHPDVTDPAEGGHPDALHLASVLCRSCEIAEAQRDRFSKERLPGERQVWRANDGRDLAGPKPPDGTSQRSHDADEDHAVADGLRRILAAEADQQEAEQHCEA